MESSENTGKERKHWWHWSTSWKSKKSMLRGKNEVSGKGPSGWYLEPAQGRSEPDKLVFTRIRHQFKTCKWPER